MIRLINLEFAYPRFRLRIREIHVGKGSKTALIGPSGSGKTTLLRLISGILTPSRGKIEVEGFDMTKADDARRRAFRISEIGQVYQDFELIDYLNVRENILLPYFVNRALKAGAEDRARVEKLADSVGISDKLERPVQELSQGEQQRVAICRALVARPALLLADEPTGDLDPDNSQNIRKTLFETVESAGATLVMATHDHSLLDGFDRVIDFRELER